MSNNLDLFRARNLSGNILCHDLGLIQHTNNLTQTITYKFFNYMSAGPPLLNSLETRDGGIIG